MKKTKCRKGGNFNLFMGILVGILAGVACGVRWLISTNGDTWLRAITKQLTGQERQLMSPEMVTKVTEYLKNDYILIALIAAAAFILLAIIFYIADGANKKKALKRAYKDQYEEEYAVEESATDDYYYADDAAVKSEPVASAQTDKECVFKNMKAKVSAKLADENVKKVATVATACVVTAVIASQVGNAIKAKRRHNFYRWLG